MENTGMPWADPSGLDGGTEGGVAWMPGEPLEEEERRELMLTSTLT